MVVIRDGVVPGREFRGVATSGGVAMNAVK